MEADDIFQTWLDVVPGLDDSAIKKELDKYVVRQTAIQRFSAALLTGQWTRGDIAEFGDLLAETDVDPDEYANMVAENIDIVIAKR